VAQSKTFPSAEALHAEILDTINRFTMKLIGLLQPTRGVYLAVDGVPPLAKIQQQRKRRYMSLYEKRFKNESSLWNSNIVTPGTSFMEDLATSLRGIEAPVPIVISDWREEGEGEHKIFHYLADKPPASVVIYGLDADMIMLSLLHPEHNIVLAREKDCISVIEPQMRHFSVVDIDRLRGLLLAKMGTTDIGCVHDYIVLCMFVGNDFVPPLSFLQILNEDIDILLDVYTASKVAPTERLVQDGSELNYKLLGRILQKLSDDEDAMMKRATEEYYAKQAPKCYDKKKQVEHAWKYYPLLYKFPKGAIDPAPNNGWRLQYYNQLFGMDNEPMAIVESYLEGLEWNLAYYKHNAAPAEQWYYPYTYSPTIKDLCNYVVANNGIDRRWRDKYTSTAHITPLIQLLAVIPPENKELLPERYRPIYSNLEHGCVHFYPAMFKIVTFLKQFAWETVPLLPNVEINDIARAIDALRE
jgi:5'-3' exoribonuclease 1